MKTGYSFGSLASFVETLDKTTVKLSGDQLIDGLKGFAQNPYTNAAQGQSDGHLTRKDYVDTALALKAPLASPALTGTPTTPTQAQFDNSTKIATNEFVQRALGNKSNVVIFTENSYLLASDVGKQVYLSGNTYYTVGVCAPTTVPSGACYSFVCTNSGSVNLYCETKFLLNNGALTTTINLKQGDTLEMVATGSSWVVCGGSASLRNAGDFKASLATNGYQKLPSGLIIQWGSSERTGSTTVTFPIRFPNACYSVCATFNSQIQFPGLYTITVRNLDLAGFTPVKCYVGTGGGNPEPANEPFTYIAIGQ